MPQSLKTSPYDSSAFDSVESCTRAEPRKTASQGDSGDAPARDGEKKAASRAVEDAEKRIEETRRVREGDRIGTTGGGSGLRPEYHERLREADAELDQAREQLKGTR